MFRAFIDFKNSRLRNGKSFSQRQMATKIIVQDNFARIIHETPNDYLEKTALRKMHDWFETHKIPSTPVSATFGIEIDKQPFENNLDSILVIQDMALKTTTRTTIKHKNDEITAIEIEALDSKPLNEVSKNLETAGITSKIIPHGFNQTLFASSANKKIVNIVEKTLEDCKKSEEVHSRIRLARE